jgi:long-chain fatty acid transport protein
MKLNQKVLFATLTLLLASNNSLAAGYSTGIYSTSGLATAYAGSATGIHDVSDMFFNPATIAEAKKNEFIASISYLDLRIDADGASANSKGNKVSGTESRDAGNNAFVPAFYLASPLNDKTTFGLSITSPFGLSTEYGKNWVGRYEALKSSIKTININPSLAYKITDKLAVAVGVQAQYYQAILTKAVDLSSYGASDGFGKAQGSDWGYGYNLGTTYKFNDQLKFGLGYRSKIDYKITGTTRLLSNDIGSSYSKFNAKTTTPESLTGGVAYKLNDKVELAYDTTWTRWSRLKSLTINAYQDSNLTDSSNFNWKDSFLYSLGANFTLNNKWLLRAGTAYEKDAVTDAGREPRVPSGDRIWTTFGFSYKVSESLAIDSSYVHEFFRTVKSNLAADSATTSSFSAKYKTRVDVISVAVKKTF